MTNITRKRLFLKKMYYKVNLISCKIKQERTFSDVTRKSFHHVISDFLLQHKDKIFVLQKRKCPRFSTTRSHGQLAAS